MKPSRRYRKEDFPVGDIRRFLEPGPIVLVSSAHKAERNVMTMGWHTVMEFTPSLIGCVISSANHSFAMIRRSRECVINIPTVDIAETVVGIGNTSGDSVDKFARFGLTATDATTVDAPLIAECHTSIECRLHDAKLVERYNFFIFEAVKAHWRRGRNSRGPSTIAETGRSWWRGKRRRAGGGCSGRGCCEGGRRGRRRGMG